MTLPSSRQRSWIYPEQRERMKTHHLREAKESHPTIEYLSEHNSAHDNWGRRAHEQVLESVKDNHTKDMYRLNNAGPPRLNRNTVKLSFRTHRHPERLSGGVYTSKEGQQYAVNRIKERVTELDARKSAVFGQVIAPQKISGPPGRDPNILKIDNAFTNVYDSLQSGDYLNLVSNTRAAVGELLSYGAKLGSAKIAELTQTAGELRQTVFELIRQGPQADVMVMTGNEHERAYGLSRSKISQLKSALMSIERGERILDELARVANLNETERSLALNNFKQKTPSLAGFLSDQGSEAGSDTVSDTGSESEGAGRRRHRHSHPLMGRGKPRNTEGSELLYELNKLGDDAQKKNDFWNTR